MKNKNLFALPIKSLNNYIKESLVKITDFDIKKHNVIKFGNKNFMLKVARITIEQQAISFKKFNRLTEYICHLNQLYIEEFDNLLLCLIFKDNCIYITIPKKDILKLNLTQQHNKYNCFQCEIDIKKYIKNKIKF